MLKFDSVQMQFNLDIQDVYGLIQDIYGLIQDIHGLIQDTHGLIQDIHGSSHGPLQTGTPKQASNMINDSVITYAQIAPDRAHQHGVLRSGFQMSAFKKQRLCPYVDAARGPVVCLDWIGKSSKTVAVSQQRSV
jgi:hypothetical protein